MIKPMVVDLEVDAILGDGFYYCFFYSQKELGFTKSYLGFENTCTFSGTLNVSRRNQGLNGIVYKEFLLLIVTPSFHICTS